MAGSLPLAQSGLVPKVVEAEPAAATFNVDLDGALEDARAGHLRLATTLGMFDLNLEPNPIAKGAVWGIDGVPMGVVSETTTFKGVTATGDPVRLGITPRGILGVIFTPDPVQIDPAWLIIPGAGIGAHVAHSWSQLDAARPAESLEGDAFPVDVEGELPESHEPTTAGPIGTPWRTARFLLESDNAFYTLWTSSAWRQAQQAALNVAEFLFDEQTSIAFVITSQWACANASACPYSGTDMGAWLSAFRNRWEAITNEPAHDLGHLLIGTNLPNWSGVAAIGGLGTSWAYAVSEFAAYAPATSILTGLPNEGTVAHEIGHNFDGVHEEATVVVAELGLPTGTVGHTIMWPTSESHDWRFSDGVQGPQFDNLERILTLAADRL